MKKLIKQALAVLVLLVSVSPVFAQDQPSSVLTYSWPIVNSASSTGQVGKYLVLANNTLGPAINNYSVDWTVTGTPGACTFRVEGSSDNANWVGLDATSPAANSCTTSNGESITYKPWPYIRVNLVSWTASGGTVTFHFTGTKN